MIPAWVISVAGVAIEVAQKLWKRKRRSQPPGTTPPIFEKDEGSK